MAEVLPRAMELAERMAVRRRVAVQGTKKALNAILHLLSSLTLDLGFSGRAALGGVRGPSAVARRGDLMPATAVGRQRRSNDDHARARLRSRTHDGCRPERCDAAAKDADRPPWLAGDLEVGAAPDGPSHSATFGEVLDRAERLSAGLGELGREAGGSRRQSGVEHPGTPRDLLRCHGYGRGTAYGESAAARGPARLHDQSRARHCDDRRVRISSPDRRAPA